MASNHARDAQTQPDAMYPRNVSSCSHHNHTTQLSDGRAVQLRYYSPANTSLLVEMLDSFVVVNYKPVSLANRVHVAPINSFG